jgi:hypothetical protein
MQEEKALLMRELAELRYDNTRLDREEAFERAPSPSAMRH